MKQRTILLAGALLLFLSCSVTFTSAQTLYTDTNSVWTYFNSGTDPGAAWNQIGFNDSAWSNGVPKFGFGSDGERTSVGVAANGYTNFYFRHTFNVTGAASVANLFARFIRDDGIVVYLNGSEAFRNNMPAGTITPATQASTTISGAAEGQFVTNAVNPSMLIEGPNLLAVEVHQSHGTAFSSDLGFYLELMGDLPPQPPGVAIVNPENNAILQVSNVTINATASDTDGTVTQVQFFQGATSLGVDTAAPYGVAWNGVAPGTYTLTAVATDSQGLRGTSAPVMITVVAPLPSLIPFGATWRYLDDGSDQGTVWTGTLFPDLTWSNGVAELGYGDNDEATLVRRVGPGGTTNITFYFRHSFTVANPGAIGSLVARVVRDDGIILYLNGTEILRDNLTNNVINFLTTAAVAVEDEPLVVTNINPALLTSGLNVIAAEVHQQGIGSSDVSFDLQLIPNAGTFPPVVNITSPSNGTVFLTPADITVNASAYDRDGMIASVQFFIDGVLIGAPDMTVPYGRTTNSIGVGSHTLTAVATDNTGLTSTAVVSISVVPGTASDTIIGPGSGWRYLDDGSDQGTAWRGLGFPDSGWFFGQAELGYGDDDEMTVLRRTNDITGTTNITFYFRKVFNVNAPTLFTNLLLGLRRDDGGVVYINNTEVFRSNMTNAVGNPILYTDFAGNNTGSETAFNTTNLSPALLVVGQNIIAVEVHQQNLTSSDVSFDLQLLGQRRGGPHLRIVNTGANIALSWFPVTPGAVLQETSALGATWVNSPNQSNPQVLTTGGTQKFYRIRVP